MTKFDNLQADTESALRVNSRPQSKSDYFSKENVDSQSESNESKDSEKQKQFCKGENPLLECKTRIQNISSLEEHQNFEVNPEPNMHGKAKTGK